MWDAPNVCENFNEIYYSQRAELPQMPRNQGRILE